ncbi:MAG: hypothetical protein Q4D94_07500 [Bacillota bacterium]|nr:hypothetical protein [Bacillota bacterium]
MTTTLQKGDILLFFAGDSWLSKSISYLTNSEVTHAAMVYSEDSMVEILADGVQLNKIALKEGKKAYLMRHDPELDFEPLKKSADAYLNSEVLYDFPGLYLLGGLLIYSRLVPTPRILKYTKLILEADILLLDQFIQKKLLHHPEKTMVCSQLIYQIFYDCGGDYQIPIVGGCLSVNEIKNSRPDTVRLIDMLDENYSYKSSHVTPAVKDENLNVASPAFTENLAKELYLALTEADASPISNPDMLSASPELDCVLSLAGQFLDKLKLILHKINSNLPLDAMFVTPGDMAYHAPSLKRIDTVYIERI